MKHRHVQRGLLLASALLALVAYPRLPSRVPIHYDYAGHANGFVDKPLGALALPLGLLILHVLLVALRGYTIDIKAPHSVSSAWDTAHVGALVAAFVVFSLPSANALGLCLRFAPTALFAGAILCASAGAASYALEPNLSLGVRTPATLSSPASWTRVHSGLAYLLWASAAVLIVSIVWVVSR